MMRVSLRALALGTAVSLFACSGDHSNADSSAAPAAFPVKIIAFNDYHGNLESPGTFGVNTAVPSAERPPVGGADYLAGYVAKLNEQNPLHVVVGAGDFIGASPMILASFHDEPSVETLNRIGMEFNAVGNHEFDRGAAVGTPVPFEGAKFK